MSESEEQAQGTMLQGSDGTVYFIPHDRLSEFRVADEDSAGVRQELEKVDSEVSGFGLDASSPKLKDGVFALRAFEGPIGIKPPVLRQKEGDGIWTG